MTQTVESKRSARARAAWLTGIVLTVAVVCVLLISSTAGQYTTTPLEVLSSIKRVLIEGADPTENSTDAALWTIRFPRALLAAVIGASLALAGTVMQGIFANPLAEPSVVGVSAGAIAGAVLAAFAALVLLSFALSFACGRLPLVSSLSSGTRTILLTVALSAGAALLFPVKDAEKEGNAP